MTEPVISRLSHRSLFTGFFQAGIMGFGGVLPIARRMIVDERKWMTQAQFNELFALCQFLPGANIVNFAFAYGARQRGVTGAAAAVFGLLAAPVCIVLVLGAAYGRWGGLAAARHGLAGLAAAAAGLVLGTALKIAAPIFVRRSNILLAAVVFGLVVVAHVSVLTAMAVVLPVSLLLAWRAA